MKKDNSKVKDALIGWWHFFIYKPGSKNIYWEKIISSSVVISGFIIWIFFNQSNLDKLKRERDAFGRYTIGITSGSHKNIRGSRSISYVFNVNGIEMSDSYTWNWPVITQGGRYYVKFASNNPKNSEILFNYPVPDSIENAPDSGWANMPGY
jgi:hypothetical protein